MAAFFVRLGTLRRFRPGTIRSQRLRGKNPIGIIRSHFCVVLMRLLLILLHSSMVVVVVVLVVLVVVLVLVSVLVVLGLRG